MCDGADLCALMSFSENICISLIESTYFFEVKFLSTKISEEIIKNIKTIFPICIPTWERVNPEALV